ncbi:DUF401 family protein [Mycoplasmatota bacterium zrk1]
MVFITLFISVIFILLLANKKINLGVSFILGSILLLIINQKGLSTMIGVLENTFSDKMALTLLLTIALITVLGRVMQEYKILDKMIGSLEFVLRSAKLTIMLAPAFIGLLLVSGGALMSAPLVDKLGTKLSLSSDKKASINMLFRHGLYFIYPFSSTMILSAQLGEFIVWDFIKIALPVTLLFYIVSYIVLLRNVQDTPKTKINIKEYFKNILIFMIYSSPLLSSIVLSIIFNMPFYQALPVGIIIAYIIHLFDKKRNSNKVKDNFPLLLIKGINFKLVFTVVGVLIFKNSLGEVDNLQETLTNLLDTGIPIEIIIILASAFISFSFASVNPSVIILYPIILPLAINYDTKLIYALLIYVTGFITYYISPLHLCQILTLDYFRINLKDLYKNYKFILPITYILTIIWYIML